MQVSTGKMFPDMETALKQGVPRDDLVEVQGTPTAVRRLRAAVNWAAVERERRRKAKKRRQQQRRSRARNRGA